AAAPADTQVPGDAAAPADTQQPAGAVPAGAPPATASADAAAPQRGRSVSRLLALRAKSGIFLPRVHEPQTRISTRAIEPPAPPSSLGAALLARCWRCAEVECPSF